MPKRVYQFDSIFQLFPKVKLVYLFGSRAVGQEGPLSDYDFAAYIDEQDVKKRFNVRLDLLDKLSRELRTDNIDLSVLNDIQSPELKYSIISSGRLIYKKEPYKVLIEPRILSEYFDFTDSLQRYGLTKNIWRTILLLNPR